MKELHLSPEMIVRMEEIYSEMEAAYDLVAGDLRFGCEGCSDNCCDSYFLHHTYAEWSYLWLGIDELPRNKQKEVLEKAHEYIIAAETAMQRNERPQVMCPLNENGLCMIYKYRLMVCRTHGVPAQITRPDGKTMSFPGCFRCQEQVKKSGGNPPMVERTAMLTKLAFLEQEYLENKRHLYPRVKLTIAEMLVKGCPVLP
jgi:Fe-S-cluster containining protein